MRVEEWDDPGFKLLFLAVPVAIIFMIVLMTVLPQKSVPAPKNDAAFGCYTSDKAPAILMNSAGLHILQKEFPIIPFHLERTKGGIATSADRPIQATEQGNRYNYSFYHPGVGEYIYFFHVADGKRYAIIDESELSNFTVLARDGEDISYSSVDPGECLMPGNRKPSAGS